VGFELCISWISVTRKGIAGFHRFSDLEFKCGIEAVKRGHRRQLALFAVSDW